MQPEVDVVVIGAGIVGAATALALVRAGSTVAIVDRSQANTQGSGTTAGNLHIQSIHTRRPGQGTPMDVKKLLPLQYSTSILWDGLAENVPRLGLNRCGGFMVAETEAQVASLHEKHEWETAAGIPTEVSTGSDARQALPLLGQDVLAATWCDWDGFAEPDLATPALLRQAILESATFYPDTPVTALDRRTDGWVVTSFDRTWNAHSVIDAAGPWMADVAALAGVHLDLRPTSLQMHTLEAAPGTLEVLVQHVGEGMSVKQDRRGRIVLGGGWPAGPFHPTEKAPLNTDSTTGSRAQVSRILPPLGNATLLDAWTGPVVTTPDEMPVIGEIDSARGLFLAGGTYSFTFAPLWANVLTSLVLGKTPPVDVDAYSPARLVATPTL